MFACRVFGHRFRFRTEGRTMRWDCGRCGAAGGAKQYSSPERARELAAALDHEDLEKLGRGAPILGMFPLRVVRYLRRKAGQ